MDNDQYAIATQAIEDDLHQMRRKIHEHMEALKGPRDEIDDRWEALYAIVRLVSVAGDLAGVAADAARKAR